MTSETAAQQRPSAGVNAQTLAAIAWPLVIGGLGGAAIYAATQGHAHTMGGGTHGMPAPGLLKWPPDARPAAGWLTGHSRSRPDARRYTASTSYRTATAATRTKLTQTGTVDEVTLSTVVVRSDDGYIQIYTFPSAAVVSKSTVAANDTVTVAPRAQARR